MPVKHVCLQCGATLTLDSPMPSLRCPKCKTAMQPETVSRLADTPADAVPVMRVARTVSVIGPQQPDTSSIQALEDARRQAKQEGDRMIQAAKDEANAIIENARQNAQQLQNDADAEARRLREAAENEARQILENARHQQPQEPEKPAENSVPDQSVERQKAEIDRLAHENQHRFWCLNAYVVMLALSIVCAAKAMGNTLVTVLSCLSACIALTLTVITISGLKTGMAQMKAQKPHRSPSASDSMTPPSVAMRPHKVPSASDTSASTARKPLLAPSRKTPAKPLVIRKSAPKP